MNDWPLHVLGALAKTAAMQLVALAAVGWLLQRLRYTSPAMCRAVCGLVLLQGWLLIPLTVSIPWYDPPPETASISPGDSSADDALRAAFDGRVAGELPVSSIAGERLQRPRSSAAIANPWVALRRQAWIGWTLLGAWLAGLVLLVASAALRYARFVWTLPPGLPADKAWLRQWRGLLASQGVRREIPLIFTEKLGPMLCRLPRGYAVLAPEEFWRGSTTGQRLAILRHELGHYQRGDTWKSLLAWLLALPQWFNPGVWWLLRQFRQCGESCCDCRAASTPSERLDYARALRRLVAMRLPTHSVGQCAHFHPIVGRVRFLLNPKSTERCTMKQLVLVGIAGALFLVQAVRVELVAKEVTYTKETAHQKILQLDDKIDELGAQLEGIKAKAAAIEKEVGKRLDTLKRTYLDYANLSEEMKRRLTAVEGGDEAQELKAIDGAEKLGDEGVILLALAAKESTSRKVRRKALETALAMGVDGFPVFAHALESMSDEDRIFLIDKAAEKLTPERMVGLCAIVEHSGEKVQEAAIKVALESPKRALLVAALAQYLDDEATVRLVGKVAELEGEDSLVLLYAAAGHGTAKQRIAAVKAAVSSKQQGLPILAAAFSSDDPEVRAEVVRAAKAIGGEVAEYGIQEALGDPNAELRKAAEKALQEAKQPKKDAKRAE